MGGGPAIRTAKFTGFSALSGFRNHLSTPSRAEQAVSRAARPVSGIASGPSNDIHVNSKKGEIDVALLRKPSWVLDEWEFVKLSDSTDPPARVVFGAVPRLPTIEDTKEAVSVLKDTLEKIYFSSSTAGNCDNSPTVVQGFTLFKSYVTRESTTILKSLPVLVALLYLKENPEIQDVVASLATDENVLNAIMRNKKIVDFFESQLRSCALLPNTDEITEEGFTGHGSGEELPESSKNDEITEEGFTGHGSGEELPESSKNDEITEEGFTGHGSGEELPESSKNAEITEEGFPGHGSGEELPESSKNWFSRLVENVKLQAAKMGSNLSDFIFKLLVAKMVSNLPEFFKNFRESPIDENSSRDNRRGGSDSKKSARTRNITLIILTSGKDGKQLARVLQEFRGKPSRRNQL